METVGVYWIVAKDKSKGNVLFEDNRNYYDMEEVKKRLEILRKRKSYPVWSIRGFELVKF